MDAARFDRLVAEAMAVPIEGWDFTWLEGRVLTDPLPWDYGTEAARLITGATAVLDIDTGGGEVLSAFAGLPAVVVATEGHVPNVEVARSRLRPLGIEVREHSSGPLPVADGEFDLVLARHARVGDLESELARALRPGGRLLTQQVGGDNEYELTTAFDGPRRDVWDLPTACESLERAGFSIVTAAAARPAVRYTDIGAVVYQLRSIPWQVPDFSVRTHRAQLMTVAETIERDGHFAARQHRFLIEARYRHDH